jgi:hypothetical protein
MDRAAVLSHGHEVQAFVVWPPLSLLHLLLPAVVPQRTSATVSSSRSITRALWLFVVDSITS